MTAPVKQKRIKSKMKFEKVGAARVSRPPMSALKRSASSLIVHGRRIRSSCRQVLIWLNAPRIISIQYNLIGLAAYSAREIADPRQGISWWRGAVCSGTLFCLLYAGAKNRMPTARARRLEHRRVARDGAGTPVENSRTLAQTQQLSGESSRFLR